MLRHKCKGLLGAEREEFSKQLNDVKCEAKGREKKVIDSFFIDHFSQICYISNMRFKSALYRFKSRY